MHNAHPLLRTSRAAAIREYRVPDEHPPRAPIPGTRGDGPDVEAGIH
ncbi:hypothetical protein [Streptomyces sp. SCA2-2]|nr:hypothetical protein [Streptomyces sp. SCA2-2]